MERGRDGESVGKGESNCESIMEKDGDGKRAREMR